MPRSLCLVLWVALAGWAAPGDKVSLPNPDFEKVGAGGVDSYVKGGFKTDDAQVLGLPDGWSAYQWGAEGSRFSVAAERGAGRGGSTGLRCRNIDPAAQAGKYCDPPLEPGRYRLSVWARAAKGRTSRVRIYLCNLYSRPIRITDEWRQVSVETMVGTATPRAEINIQNCSGEADGWSP